MSSVKFKSVTGGFTGSFWEVSRAPEDPVHVVYALSNYEAAEACGWRFAECWVRPMKLVLEETAR